MGLGNLFNLQNTLEKNYFVKKEYSRIIFFRGYYFREITTKSIHYINAL